MEKRNRKNNLGLWLVIIGLVGIVVGLSLRNVIVVNHFEIDNPIIEKEWIETDAGIKQKVEWFEMDITAYSEIDSCHYPNCAMANGKRAEYGYVACPRNIKLGTQYQIRGLGYFVCGDRYAKRLGDRLDVFLGYGFNNYQRALDWGVQRMFVRIVK
jgi:3D (Asp-Asp-Asp) domain-containing protein